jgi:hypothetical protein
MSTNDVTIWLQIVQKLGDDRKIAAALLANLHGYTSLGTGEETMDTATLIDLFTAIRIDQMSKEINS